MSDNFGFCDRYLSTDGKEYVDADCVREALGIVDEYVDIFGVIKKLRKERDELKEKCDKLKTRTNAAYGVSCGYSGDKAPAFLCDVISYSWELGPIEAHSLMDKPSYRVPNDSIRVELNLTPTANYKGTFDMEDLKKYIQAYGREKKLGIIESVDYQNAKVARAELAYLYKTVLGKDRLDRDLSPHEVMKAILDEYKSGRMERLPELVNDCIDELCDKYNVIQPVRSRTTRERLDYIFAVLADYREMHDSEWNRVEKLIKEKRAVEDSLAELRAKIREIHRSVVDDEWNNLSYTSALNDINEEYKRVARNFEKDTFRSAICNALGMPTTSINGNIIGRIHMMQDCHDKLCKDYTDLRKAIWEAMGKKTETLPGDDERLVGEVQTLAYGDKWLREFRDEVAKAIGMDYPTTNTVILNNVKYFYKVRNDAYGMVSKLNDQVTALEKAKEDLQQKFEFQSGLRRTWHARYESEHERANCVQKALDREREKSRVKDISLETAKKQYEKVCSNLETAECAINGMKSKVRSLQEEKTKVISALGQDIWDDCLKEEENNE